MRVCHHCGIPGNEADRFCARCGSAYAEATATDPLIGRTIGGSYTLQETIGVGGMGRVYRAEQGVLGRTVAVKVIHPHLLGDEQNVARFYTEARAASRLNHPNSVSIIDFGRTDDGILYLVMEHLQGKDLSIVLHEEGPLPFVRICDILIAVLGALGEAHALGVVHRDLKPENIILKRFRSGGDVVKVVDFGLATIIGGGATSITAPGLVCGTPDYMSPEQGQGDVVDGRGDIYSLGVMLFELLTDELPYVDETPTKVVMRHINDPIPDPRERAPQRSIPVDLATLTIRALAKNAADRIQSAEEFAAALRHARDALKHGAIEAMACRTCGAKSPATMRFCGTCGARLTGLMTVPPTGRSATPSRLSYLPTRQGARPFIGRDDEMALFAATRVESKNGPRFVHLVGESGIGKTRILREVMDAAAGQGDLVVASGPHPSRAPVAYGPIRELLMVLLDVDDAELAKLAGSHGFFGDPLTRAGLQEVTQPHALADGSPRTGAVAAALAAAIPVGVARSDSGQAMLVVDDLGAIDGLSQQVLLELPNHLRNEAIVVATAGPEHLAPRDARMLAIPGLPVDSAGRYFGADALFGAVELGERHLLPLYLDQVMALGGLSALDDSLSLRLADLVAQRIERLDVHARRLLQAVAVLGDRCTLEWLREVVEGGNLKALETLEKHELVYLAGNEVVIAHPFIRDLVEASIPAEARKARHQRALTVAVAKNAPLEVRAEHAYRAGESMSALMLLERMGDAGLEHGDPKAAVLAYRRALELARREMLETGDVVLDAAIVTFSRKLGEALERSGDVSGADGVLREAVDLAGPASIERARMLLALGWVATRRERRRDAGRLFGQALEIAHRLGDVVVESRVQEGIGHLRREEGDHIGAANAIRRAAEIYDEVEVPAEKRAAVRLELFEVLMDLGDAEEAQAQLQLAWDLADRSHSPSLTAHALGALASIDEMAGDRVRATERYREAARLAADSGDCVANARWLRAAEVLVN